MYHTHGSMLDLRFGESHGDSVVFEGEWVDGMIRTWLADEIQTGFRYSLMLKAGLDQKMTFFAQKNDFSGFTVDSGIQNCQEARNPRSFGVPIMNPKHPNPPKLPGTFVLSQLCT